MVSLDRCDLPAQVAKESGQSWQQQTLRTIAEQHEVITTVLQAMDDRVWSDRDGSAVRLALNEALTNAIRHGHRNDTSRTVTLRSLVLPDQIWLEVEDEGPGFDPATPASQQSVTVDIPARLEENSPSPSGSWLLLCLD